MHQAANVFNNRVKQTVQKTVQKTQDSYKTIKTMTDIEKKLIEAGKKASAVQAVDENITKVIYMRYNRSSLITSAHFSLLFDLLQGYESDWYRKWINYCLCC
jgi:hypothetical protein